MRVLAVADSDSYIKWGAAVLERAPAHWERSIVVVATPAAPSPDQLAAALAGTSFAGARTAIAQLAQIAARVAAEQPDVVLLAVRGPVVRVLIRAIAAAAGRRPVFVSGLPGISIPPTRKALYYRAQADLFLLHSKREVRGFAKLADSMGIAQSFALARLPFLVESPAPTGQGRDIVFAAQAKVPRAREDRELVLHWLIATARANPALRVVVKLRAAAGEQQTHGEKYPYDQLLGELDAIPPNLVVEGGPMTEHLARAVGLVTISSTAAIEAAAAGVPVLVLDDFGMSAELINPVFEHSGLFGSSADLIAARFSAPDPQWLDDNYFHAADAENWVAEIERAVHLRESDSLPVRAQFRGSLGGNLRRVWDRKRALGSHDRSISGFVAIAVGVPARSIVLFARSPARALRRAGLVRARMR